MNVARSLLALLGLVCHAESRCSPTTYYKNCWIRQFPGIFIDIDESQRRGAQLLRFYQEETALTCSRTCCLMRNFSCNLAIFHYDTTQENCLHLLCPTLESCILRHRGNTVLYNITNGVDPDLLVFGNYFTSNVRVLPHHYSRVNSSDPLPSDKRQFIHPPPPAPLPLTPSSKLLTSAASESTTAAEQSTSRLTTTSASTAVWSSSGKTPASSQTAPTTSATTTAQRFMTASTAVPSPSHYDPQTSAFSSTTTQLSTTIAANHQTTTDLRVATSPPTATTLVDNTEGNKQDGNDTQVTEGGQEVSGEDTVAEFGPGWHVAAYTLLVAVVICATVLLCCCSVLLLVSWKGQKKRMGHYRTSCRRKSGSMRLIKYVLDRENS